MKTLYFADSKRPILTFEAEHVDIAQDADGLIVQANGCITEQDSEALQEAMHSNYACLFTVKEAGEELLHGRFQVVFLNVEPEQMAARITPEA